MYPYMYLRLSSRWLTRARRADGRRAQEAATRAVKMIGPTNVTAGSPTMPGGSRSLRVDKDQPGVGPFLSLESVGQTASAPSVYQTPIIVLS